MIKKPVGLPVLARMMIASCMVLIAGCATSIRSAVPHAGRWGLYMLDLATQDIDLIYSSPQEIGASSLRLNSRGTKLLFAQKIAGDSNEHFEICTIEVDGTNFKQLTTNRFWDIYPAWSPDDTLIAFLSLRQADLDLYVMNADGTTPRRLYDSGSHDADVDWGDGGLVFTADSRIWLMRSTETEPLPVTAPPRAGQWGTANLPFGDYDPRLSPDGTRIVFERLEDDRTPQGNYNIYLVDSAGTAETRLTDTGFTQGLASWSHAGDRIIYTIAAVNGAGAYDLYLMNADGTNSHRITPDYVPDSFLSHAAVFSADDARVFFVGEWWEQASPTE